MQSWTTKITLDPFNKYKKYYAQKNPKICTFCSVGPKPDFGVGPKPDFDMGAKTFFYPKPKLIYFYFFQKISNFIMSFSFFRGYNIF